MARRSDHSREELHDLTLEAAREVVVEGGLKALTARNIADAIGYSPGTLYNIFTDLDDLIIHLNGRTMDELYERLSLVSGPGEPVQVLKQILQRYLEYLEEHRNLWNILFEHRLPDDQPLPDWYVAKLARLLGIIEKALAPIFPPEERNALESSARVLWASLQGISSLSETGKLQVVSSQPIHEMAEMQIECFVAGLQKIRRSGATNA